MTLSEIAGLSVALLLALSLVGYSGFEHAKTLGYNEAVSIYEQQKAADKKITDAATKQLQDKADQAAKDKEDAIKAADAKYADLLNSVSKRTTRPAQTGSGPVASVDGSCTGVQLYRDDAEFLIGFAKRAADVQIERDFYYERYEDARRLLSGEASVGGQQGTVPDTESVSGNRVQP